MFPDTEKGGGQIFSARGFSPLSKPWHRPWW